MRGRERRDVAAEDGDGVCVEDDEVDEVGVARLAGFGAVFDGDGDVGGGRALEGGCDFGDLSAEEKLEGTPLLGGTGGEEVGGVSE